VLGWEAWFTVGVIGALLARFMLPTAVLSGFLNNTPIVAMLTPRLQEWAQERGLSPSKVMIPLSHAAISGGMLTLIGTSTNLIVSGLLETEGYAPLGFFDVTWVGGPAMACVVSYFMIGGHKLLPDRAESPSEVEEKLQEGLFELKVAVQSPLVGLTVEEAELRSIEDACLVHLRRGEKVIQATPRTVVDQGDVLAFTASATAIRRLLRRSGLKRNFPTDGMPPSEAGYQGLPLFEAVVSDSSYLVGKTLGEANFRERYQGVVLGIQRKDESIQGPIAARAVVYLATNLLTELITNNAAAVLMLPVSLSTASSLGVPPEAFAVVVAVAASASFITPIGYQTNLMVMSPGGYRFGDYTRVGWPLSVLILAVTVAVVSTLWL